jgi:PAS domain S-box-containing protein
MPNNELHLQSLFSGGPVVLLIWRPDPGWPLEYVSPNCEALFGYPASDMTAPGFLYTGLLHPEDLPHAAEEVRRHLDAATPTWEQRYRILRPDGQVRWVYDFTTVERDARGELLHLRGYVLDQTNQVLSEQALRESELRWQFALEGAGDGLWDWNALTNKVFFSKHWKTMLGYAEHEIGDSLHEWDSRIHPEDRERCFADLERHFSGETEYYQNEHRMRCKDGSYRWILDRGKTIQWSAEGKPLRVIGTHTDISARKATEEALREAELRYRTLHELMPDGVLLIDPETALPLEFNATSHEQLGYTREEFAGLRIQDYEAAESPEETAAHIRTLLETGRDDFETRHRRKDGSTMHVLVTVKIVELQGKPALLTVFRDISEMKLAQQALRDANDQLELKVKERTAELQHALEDLRKAKDRAESASRMKTDFLMNVSHELRTPLNGVQGMLQLLDQTQLDPEQQECLAEVHASTKRLLKIVDEALVVTSLDKHVLTISPVGLQSLLDAFTHTLEPKCVKKGLELHVENSPNCPPVLLTDVYLLQLILGRIGENAYKFTEQGAIRLSVSCSEHHPGQAEIRFTIADTGMGIPPDKLDTLVSGLVQGDSPLTRRHSGLGLGLETVRKALALLGGRLEVQSAPNEGSQFHVVLWSEYCNLDNLDACVQR